MITTYATRDRKRTQCRFDVSITNVGGDCRNKHGRYASLNNLLQRIN